MATEHKLPETYSWRGGPRVGVIPTEAPESNLVAQVAGLEALRTLAVTQPLCVIDEEISSHKQSTSGRVQPFWKSLVGPWPLIAVLGLQTLLSLRLMWSNTAFQDEALYIWAGHLELAHWQNGMSIPDFPSYFSGAPVIYPPLAALANNIGGLAAARFLSEIFILGTTALLYAVTCRLFDRRSAIASATLFAVFGCADQLGALATYDAMALFLTALAAFLVVRAQGKISEPLLICAGMTLGAADATKYASALWNPIVFALAALVATRGGIIYRLLRATRLAIYTAIPLAIALHIGGREYLHGIIWTTLDRQVADPIPSLRVLDIAWGWLALLLLLGILGVWLAWYDYGSPHLLPILLITAGILAPIEQARAGEITSLHKHVVFGAWFLCMMAGYAVSRISHVDGKFAQGAIVGGVLVGVFAMTGFVQATAFMTSWPQGKSAMQALAKSLHSSPCPCLIFQEFAADYYLPPTALTGGVTGPWVFNYADNKTQQELSGVPAMVVAIGNEYFSAVEIDASQGSITYQDLDNALRRSGEYRLVSSTSWALHPGEPTQVWERTAGDSA